MPAAVAKSWPCLTDEGASQPNQRTRHTLHTHARLQAAGYHWTVCIIYKKETGSPHPSEGTFTTQCLALHLPLRPCRPWDVALVDRRRRRQCLE